MTLKRLREETQLFRCHCHVTQTELAGGAVDGILDPALSASESETEQMISCGGDCISTVCQLCESMLLGLYSYRIQSLSYS